MKLHKKYLIALTLCSIAMTQSYARSTAMTVFPECCRPAMKSGRVDGVVALLILEAR